MQYTGKRFNVVLIHHLNNNDINESVELLNIVIKVKRCFKNLLLEVSQVKP